MTPIPPFFRYFQYDEKIIFLYRFCHIASVDKALYIVYAICKRCTISVPDFEAHTRYGIMSI